MIDSADAIDVVTPTKYHFEYAKMAIEKGKHLFVEKPITATIGEAQKLVKLADKEVDDLVERLVDEGGFKKKGGPSSKPDLRFLSYNNGSITPFQSPWFDQTVCSMIKLVH